MEAEAELAEAKEAVPVVPEEFWQSLLVMRDLAFCAD